MVTHDVRRAARRTRLTHPEPHESPLPLLWRRPLARLLLGLVFRSHPRPRHQSGSPGRRDVAAVSDYRGDCGAWWEMPRANGQN